MTEYEDRLRDGLRTEASRVHPREGLATIRGRTEARSTMRRGWWVSALSGIAAVTLVAGGVALVQGWPGGQGGESTVAVGPSASASPDPTEASIDSSAQEATVWVVRGETNDKPPPYALYPRIVTVAGSDPGVAAVEALLAYDPPGEDGADVNVWHDGVGGPGGDEGTPLEVTSVQQHGGVVTVDFRGAVEDPWPTVDVVWVFDPALFSQQLVRTVQDALDTTDPVLVTQDGEPVDAVLTAPVKQPIQADDAVLAHVYVTSPADDTTVDGPLTVTGESMTFEAAVNWRVLQAGEVVDEGYAMGGSYGEWKPFRFSVDLPPGSYVLEVFETSAKDGSRQSVDTRRVTVE